MGVKILICGHFATNTAVPNTQCYNTSRSLLTSEGVVGNTDQFCRSSLGADWLGASGAYRLQCMGHHSAVLMEEFLFLFLF